jgi:large subunit ribosomal protein L15
MPKQRRLPKTGFVSVKKKYVKTIRSFELNKFTNSEIDVNFLRNSKLMSKKYKYVKIISSGNMKKDINIKGINITKGVRVQIEKNGGKIT